MQEAFVDAINEMLGNSDEYLKKLKSNSINSTQAAAPAPFEEVIADTSVPF